MDTPNIKEEIIECLILHQPYIKKQLEALQLSKEEILVNNPIAFRMDIEEQYDLRVKQWIGFYIGDTLPSIPIELIMIELEKIDIEDFLNV